MVTAHFLRYLLLSEDLSGFQRSKRSYRYEKFLSALRPPVQSVEVP